MSSSVVLFVGGPLHGEGRQWVGLPDYYPRVLEGGMVPYARTAFVVPGYDAVYAPIGMSLNAITDGLTCR